MFRFGMFFSEFLELCNFWTQIPRAIRIEPKCLLEVGSGGLGIDVHTVYTHIYGYRCMLSAVVVSLSQPSAWPGGRLPQAPGPRSSADALAASP